MPHKFVPRKGFKKDQPPSTIHGEPIEPQDATPTPTPPPPPAAEVEPTEPDALPEPAEDEPPITKEPVVRGKSRSAKDSILKKLPPKPAAPKSMAAMRGPRSSNKLFENRPKPAPAKVRVPSGVPAGGLMFLSLLAFVLIGGGAALFLMAQVPGYKSSVAVSNPTRLDWTFVDSRRSLDKPRPEHNLYDPKRASYELYIPPEATEPLPAIVFISGDKRASGWSAWRDICQGNVAYISPHNAGDDRPLWERVRATLDALDDVRREHKIDPNRTYLVGLGGGARVACKIAFALPELFGGVVGIGGGDLPRDELWLRDRMIDRLSVGWVMGERDPSLPEVKVLYTPMFEKLKVRTKTWIVPNLARSMPPADTLKEVYAWLDEVKEQRTQVAAGFPAMAMPPDQAWTRTEAAAKLLEEAKLRVAKPETYTSGTAQLGGITERWERLPPANDAQRLYQQTLQQDKQTLVKEIQVRHAQDLEIARALTSYLLGDLNSADMVANGWMFERYNAWHELAVDLWNRLISNRPPEAEEKEAADAIEKLREKRAKGIMAPAPAK